MPEQNFPKYRQRLNLLLKRLSKELAGSVSGFTQLRRESMAEGTLSRKSKELMRRRQADRHLRSGAVRLPGLRRLAGQAGDQLDLAHP